jgi:hypothetical protein
MNTCETVRVKCDKVPGNDLGFYVINKSDFNADQHELFDEEVALQPTPEQPVAPPVQEQAAPWLRK